MRWMISAAALGLMTATGAFAQSAADEQNTEVVVLGKKLLPAQTTSANKSGIANQLTPQAIQVVPQLVLEGQNVQNLSEATKNVAGVALDFGFNGSTQPLLIMRGFTSTSMTAFGSMLGSSNYYLDGTRLSGVPINMADAKAVEVIKGPNSVLFGRGEPGGLVNVISKGLRVKPGFDFEQTLGENGLSRTYVNVSGAVTEDKSLLLGVTGTNYDTKSNRDFVEEHIDAYGVRAQWQASEKTKLFAAVDYLDQAYRNDYGLPAVNGKVSTLPLNVQFNNAPDLSRIRSLTGRVEVTHNFSDNWNLKARAVKLSADAREVDVTPYRQDLTFGGNCDGMTTNTKLCRYYYYARPDGKNEIEQFNVDLTGKIVWGGVTHNLLFSADSYASKKTGALLFSEVAPADISTPTSTLAPRIKDTFVLDTLNYIDMNNWQGMTAQDQIDFGNGLNLLLALRQDRSKASYSSAPVTVDFTSPRIGLVYAINPHNTVYAQYQKSLAANNGRDVDAAQTPLKPEIASQNEVGYKYSSNDGNFTATVAAYELVKRNRADFSLYPTKIQTIGEARSRGLELDVLGKVTSKLSLIGSFSYDDTEVTKDTFYQGKALANAPKEAASLWASYEVNDHWRLGGGAFYQGDRWGDVGNTFILPAYTRIDAMAAYDFVAYGTKASLQLNVNNLFDTRYYSGAHQFVSDWVQPGAPRTVSLTLRLAY